MSYLDNIKQVTFDIKQIKNNTPIIKIGDKFFVGGVGGSLIPEDVQITLGIVNEDKKFQALKFNNGKYGFADGEPQTVETYYKWLTESHSITVTTPVSLTGTSYESITPLQLTASDSVSSTLSYAFDSNVISGLSISNTGLISGIPQKSGSGSFGVYVSAEGAGTKIITVNYTLSGIQYPSSTKEGTIDNPYYWDDWVDTTKGNRKHTIQFSTVGKQNNRVYFYVFLLANKSYNIGLGEVDADGYIRLYNSSNEQVSGNDDEYSTVDGTSTVSTLSYTPTNSGWYKICGCSYDDYQTYTTGTINMNEQPGQVENIVSSSSSGE